MSIKVFKNFVIDSTDGGTIQVNDQIPVTRGGESKRVNINAILTAIKPIFITSNYTVQDLDRHIVVTTSSEDITITLPSSPQEPYKITNSIDSNASYVVKIVPPSGDFADGSNMCSLANGQSRSFGYASGIQRFFFYF